jgi:hypothetical protein
MRRLVIISGVHRGFELELRRGTHLLGRGPGVHFEIEDPTVSSRHCEFIVSDFGVRVRDLGSTNGTLVDGQPIAECDLKDGQVLSLGAVQFRLVVPPVHIAIPPLPAAPAPEQATTLEDGTPACLHHPDVPASWRCQQCSQTLCEDCVRELHRVGGEARWFCSVCSGLCEPVGAPVVTKRFLSVRSIARRLIETIRIKLLRSKPRPARRAHRRKVR